jgi:hypothetical protein
MLIRNTEYFVFRNRGMDYTYIIRGFRTSISRPHRRFTPPRILFIPDSRTYPVRLSLKRRCDQTPWAMQGEEAAEVRTSSNTFIPRGRPWALESFRRRCVYLCLATPARAQLRPKARKLYLRQRYFVSDSPYEIDEAVSERLCRPWLAAATTSESLRWSAAFTPSRGRSKPRAWSHCRFVPPLIHLTPDSLGESVPLFLNRQCDRTLSGPGGVG